jgi:hypothetical protein
MKITAIFRVFFLLAAVQSMAQNADSLAIKKYYDENAILWLGGLRYYKNNESFGLKHLKEEFKPYPIAAHEYSQYRTNRAFLTGTALVGVSLLVSSYLVHDRHTRQALALGSVISFAIAIPFAIKTKSHLSRAIWIHNRDMLLR